MSNAKVENEAEASFELAEVLANLKSAGPLSPGSDRIEWLSIDRIEPLPELFQPRGINEKHIGDLVRAIQNFGEVEPLMLLRVGERNILIDGHHRLEAYRLAGKTDKIAVRFYQGSVEGAVLEAGKANAKVKLPMSTAERMDYGWRLVLLDTYSRSEISEAAVISEAQVSEMRRVMRHLGEEAFSTPSWWQARRIAKGTKIEMSEEQRGQWKEEQAERFAGRLAQTFSTRLAKHPEIAAMALAQYFGRKLPEVWQELRAYLSDEEQEADLENSEF